jgi:hypothetical protein
MTPLHKEECGEIEARGTGEAGTQWVPFSSQEIPVHIHSQKPQSGEEET